MLHMRLNLALFFIVSNFITCTKDPESWILSDSERILPLRLNTLQKTGKNQKTVLPDLFSQFDQLQHTK